MGDAHEIRGKCGDQVHRRRVWGDGRCLWEGRKSVEAVLGREVRKKVIVKKKSM